MNPIIIIAGQFAHRCPLWSSNTCCLLFILFQMVENFHSQSGHCFEVVRGTSGCSRYYWRKINSHATCGNTGGLVLFFLFFFFRRPGKGMWLIKKRDNFTPRLLGALWVHCGNIMSLKVITPSLYELMSVYLLSTCNHTLKCQLF